MQLTRAEVDDANLIVTTPEKWDVVTRKGGTDGSLATKCKLLIIDEVCNSLQCCMLFFTLFVLFLLTIVCVA